MEILMTALGLGILTGIIAKMKNRSFLLWTICGAGLFIVAFPVVLFIKPKGVEDWRCPECKEFVNQDARRCKHCAIEMTPEPNPKKKMKSFALHVD